MIDFNNTSVMIFFCSSLYFVVVNLYFQAGCFAAHDCKVGKTYDVSSHCDRIDLDWDFSHHHSVS